MRELTVTVRYYAAARELCGCGEERLSLRPAPAEADGQAGDGAPDDGTTLPHDQVLTAIAARHARFAPYAARMRLAINGEFALPGDRVRHGDEVSILPPVAGGSGPLCEVRREALSLDQAVAAVQHAGAGGIAIFVGVVRDRADGKAVARLDYEAHEGMAGREMGRVLEEVIAEIPGVRLAAQHRVGELSVGEAAVIIAASAPHRDEAFRACRAAIDRIKERVPIWKKEWAPDGSANWVNLDP